MEHGFAQKVDPIWNGPVGTGNAGALARYEREARNSYSVEKVEIERAAHGLRARAPALPVSACLFLPPLFGQGQFKLWLASVMSNLKVEL